MDNIFSDFDFLRDSVSYVTEAYYGKSKDLLMCEDICNSILASYFNDKYANLNKLQEVRELEKMFKKIFGFNEVGIYWHGSTMSNSTTIVNSHIVQSTLKAGTLKKANGYYDNTHTEKAVITLTKGLLEVENIDGAQIVALILHEIGHSLDYTPYRAIKTAITFITVSPVTITTRQSILASELLSSNILKGGIQFVMTIPDRIIQSSPAFFKAINNISGFFREVGGTINVLYSPIFALLNPIAILLSPLNHFANMFGKKAEEFSDSFAVSYGYGPDLGKVLLAIENDPYRVKKYFAENTFFNFLYQLGQVNRDIMVASLGLHGTHQERVKKSIIKLRQDLDRSEYPPHMKKILLSDIRDLEAFYNRMITATEDEKVVLTVGFRKLMDDIFKGSPDIISKIIGSTNYA